MNSFSRFIVSLIMGFVTLIFPGCSGESDGPARFDLSGAVNYQGKPVPYGELIFIPDSSKGNTGASAVAKIEAGRYQTLVDKGIIGGPHHVEIKGFDNPPVTGAVPAEGEKAPNQLFKQLQIDVDFPREVSTYDFDLPLTKN